MWFGLVLALPPPAALVCTTYDDAKCPRRDCPLEMLKPRSASTDRGESMNSVGAIHLCPLLQKKPLS